MVLEMESCKLSSLFLNLMNFLREGLEVVLSDFLLFVSEVGENEREKRGWW